MDLNLRERMRSQSQTALVMARRAFGDAEPNQVQLHRAALLAHRELQASPDSSLMVGLLLGCLALGLGLAVFGEFAGPNAITAVVLAAALVGLAFVRPVWAVVLVFTGVAFGNKALPGAPFGLQLIHAVCALAIAAVALRALTDDSRERLWRVQVRLPLLLAMAFVLAAIISSATSASPDRSLKATLTLLAGLLLACVIVMTGNTVNRLRLFAAAAVVGSLFVTIPTLVTGPPPEAVYDAAIVKNRAVGAFTDPNALGAFCAMVTLLAFGWFLAARNRWEKVAALAGAGGALAALGLSLSRGAWFGVAVGGVVLVFMHPGSRKFLGWLLLGAVTLAMAALLVMPAGGPVAIMVERALSIGQPSSNPYDVRPITWREALREFGEEPVLGNGPGSFSVLSAQSGSELQFYPRKHAHNGLLTVAAEMGLTGLVPLLGMSGALALVARNRGRRLRAEGRTSELGILAGAAAGLCALIGHLLVDYPLRNPVLMIFVWALVGVVLAVVATPITRRSTRDARAA